MRTFLNCVILLLATAALAPQPLRAEETPSVVLPHAPKDWLVIERTDFRARRPFNPDAVFERHLLNPAAPPPSVDATIEGERKSPVAWKQATVNEKGRLAGSIGYAFTSFQMDEMTPAIAKLAGGGTLYVNGAAVPGDIYGLGTNGFPVVLRKGTNNIFVRGVRGSCRLAFEAPPAPVFIASARSILPDVAAGAALDSQAGLWLVNASLQAVRGIRIRMQGSDWLEPSQSKAIEYLAPLSILQVRLPLRTKPTAVAPKKVTGAAHSLSLEVVDKSNKPVHSLAMKLPIRAAEKAVLHTFVSRIDGSVQSYGLRPPVGSTPKDKIGLVLSLHGASVAPRAQAMAYSSKPDFWIAVPTNRGEYGFDWQDWGRLDAYEVLEAALRTSGVDRRRVYLTGHSMGGHGTWHLAANDPDGFAAIAPSAGWISFDTYPAKRRLGTKTKLWHRADGPSLTLSLLENLAQLPTHIVHGTKDDNVPVSQGRQMESYLKRVGGEVTTHYEEGAGHWWDGKAARGADCVDLPEIFDLFRNKVIPSEPNEIKFTTWNPAIDNRHHWISIEQQVEYGKPSTVQGRYDPQTKKLSLFTDNIALLRVIRDEAPKSIQIDGAPVVGAWPGTEMFVRNGNTWASVGVSKRPSGPHKSPSLCGPLRQAWRNKFVMVYGTKGTADETKALWEQARFDASTWSYRANGRALLIPDTVLAEAPADYAQHNLILYGNTDTNTAFGQLPASCPIQVSRDSLTLGDKAHTGADLGACFLYPSEGTPSRMIGVMGSTGVAASRLGFTLMTFVSGAGFPDYVVYDKAILREGDGGVLATGWFDRNWQPQVSGKTK